MPSWLDPHRQYMAYAIAFTTIHEYDIQGQTGGKGFTCVWVLDSSSWYDGPNLAFLAFAIAFTIWMKHISPVSVLHLWKLVGGVKEKEKENLENNLILAINLLLFNIYIR